MNGTDSGIAAQAENIETALALGRIALGVTLFAAPTLLGRRWVGDDADTTGARVLTRGLGIRDIALGVGTLLARSHGQSTRGWLEASALADLGDAAATIAAWDDLPAAGRWGTLAMAGSAAVVDGLLARVVDD